MARWLLLDTATPVAVVGLYDLGSDLDSSAVVVEVVLDVPQRHAEALPAAVERALAHGAVDGIGVGVGPGSFIGVRTGIAFAKGLARARGVPLVGIPTLQALVASCDVTGAVTAVIDAKRGEVYVQSFVDGVAVDDARACVAADVSGVTAPRSGPSLAGMGRVLRQVLASQPGRDERGSLVPVYVRAPDAKLPAVDPRAGLASVAGVLEGA